MNESNERAFICPTCGGTMTVSPATREAVLQNGCPFCASQIERQGVDVS